MKIVYCINSISHLGGIARVVVAKANALAAIDGNEVWIAYTDIDPEHPEPALPLDPRVRLIDLGIRYYADDTRGLYYRLRSDSLLRRRHRAALERELAALAPDVVISVGQSEKYFLPSLRLPKRPAYVREFHYHRNYRRDIARSLPAKFLARLTNAYDYGCRIGRYDAIAVLTQEDYNTYWARSRHAHKVRVIPNPLTCISEGRSDLTSRTVVTVGRISYEKNHESLLRAWQTVARRHPDWKLCIYGSGSLEEQLHRQIRELGLEGCVSAPGAIRDVPERLKAASVFVLTSRFEGFGLVLLEAAGAGLPLVSYACPCGPRDILAGGRNGILVPAGDEAALADAICRLIENSALRRQMADAALATVGNYSPEAIAARWQTLFSEIAPPTAP